MNESNIGRRILRPNAPSRLLTNQNTNLPEQNVKLLPTAPEINPEMTSSVEKDLAKNLLHAFENEENITISEIGVGKKLSSECKDIVDHNNQTALDNRGSFIEVHGNKEHNNLVFKFENQNGALNPEVVSPPTPTEVNRHDYYEDCKHLFGSSSKSRNDAPEPWGCYFQDNATPQMEGLEELHNNIMFYLAIILFAVSWIMVSIIINFCATKISNKYINHGTLVELIWTISPALILILIAFPSFKLLYLIDEVIDPSLVVNGEGHQWYWSYQYPDFVNDEKEYIEYDSYIIPESDLETGQLRLLEVDNRSIIPEQTHTRFIVAGADVIHSYACPSLGIKCDAYPGRLNQSSVYLNRPGTFFGQCSEICGILHSSMPIAIQSVPLYNFLFWLYDQIRS